MIILETDRLLLRHLEPGDIESLYPFYSDPEVRRYFPEGALTYAETRAEVEYYLKGHPDHPELGLWATMHKATNQFIGRCGLLPWTIDGQDEIEIAYLLGKAFWGQGLGTEAAQGIRDYAFEDLGVSRLVCVIDEDNLASIQVAKNMGMSFEKEARDELGPFQLYSINRQKWNGS